MSKEIKNIFIEFLEKRKQHFYTIGYHQYEYNQMQYAISIVRNLMPPDYFEIKELNELKSENEKLRLKYDDLKKELENVPTNSDFAELRTENEKLKEEIKELKRSEEVLSKLKNYLQDNKSPVKYSYENVLMIIEEMESE